MSFAALFLGGFVPTLTPMNDVWHAGFEPAGPRSTVQLTNHTDYALRTLIALGACAPDKMTAGEIADAYNISVHHLLKVIQKLSALGYVDTLRGKSGGVRLAVPPEQINIGQVVRLVESDLAVVPCLRAREAACVIEPACSLRTMLSAATDAFLSTLDQHTLADVLKPKPRLVQLLGMKASASEAGRPLLVAR